jgi:hypothetical protein
MPLLISLTEVDSGETMTHALSDYGNYSTLCGLSDDDEMFAPSMTVTGAKIDCPHCWSIFEACKRLRVRDFAAAAKPSGEVDRG